MAGGLFSHYQQKAQKQYSSNPANFAVGQNKVWEELSSTEKASSLFQEYGKKTADFTKEVGVGMAKAVAETGTALADTALRTSPIETVRNVASGVQEVMKGTSGAPASLAFEKGFQESKARPLMFEKLTGENLKNEDGTVNWDFARKFVGRAMEGPTYAYAGAVKGAELVGKGLLSRIVTRTASTLPEAGINTALQTGQEGNTDNLGVNFLANALLMSGVSNVVGEIKLPKDILNKTVSDIEGQVGKLTPEQKIDVQDALKQGVKSDEILTNLQKVVKNEITPDEVAEKLNKSLDGQDSKTVYSGKPKGSDSKFFTESEDRAKQYADLNKDVTGESEVVKETISPSRYKEVKASEYLDAIEKPEKGFDGVTFLEPDGTKAYAKYKVNPLLQEAGKVVKDAKWYENKIAEIKARPKKFGIDNKPVLDIYKEKLAALKDADLMKAKEAILESPTLSPEEISIVKNAKTFDEVFNVVKTKGADTQGMFTTRLQTAFKNEPKTLYNKAQGGAPKAEPKTVEVPRSQMPVGTGQEKVSRLEARMTGNLGKLTSEQIDEIGLSTYNQMNKADQIKAAAIYVTENPDNVIKILSGEMEPPKGLLKNSIYVAAENIAMDDAGLARKLASLQSTRLGQELSILSEAMEDSPVKAMREVSDARIQAVERRLKSGSVSKTRNEITKKAKESVDKTVTKAIKDDWNSFVSSITCK